MTDYGNRPQPTDPIDPHNPPPCANCRYENPPADAPPVDPNLDTDDERRNRLRGGNFPPPPPPPPQPKPKEPPYQGEPLPSEQEQPGGGEYPYGNDYIAPVAYSNGALPQLNYAMVAAFPPGGFTPMAIDVAQAASVMLALPPTQKA